MEGHQWPDRARRQIVRSSLFQIANKVFMMSWKGCGVLGQKGSMTRSDVCVRRWTKMKDKIFVFPLCFAEIKYL